MDYYLLLGGFGHGARGQGAQSSRMGRDRCRGMRRPGGMGWDGMLGCGMGWKVGWEAEWVMGWDGIKKVSTTMTTTVAQENIDN